ncbi:MAG: hypothetical protein IJ016_03675 [Elusimicrobiaceae bacterium]|nr:hypothetical protein [Elusimicrobiaceae bacterium]MBR5609115.1 hypothetical protein [Elusimicrobiaceae bacterium]
MKKLLFLIALPLLLSACASVQQAENFANCKYALRSVEIADYNINSLSFDMYVSITNLNKKEAAAIKKFEGKLTMNDTHVADINFADVRVEPGAVKNQKVHMEIPMSSFSNKLLGLVSMGSGTVDYHLTGTATFDTPLGEVPIPVDIGRIGSTN